MAETKMIGVRFLPALMVVALVCVFVALGLLAFAGKETGGDDKSMREMNELLALSQKLPLQANAALSGTPGAFNALSESRSRYSTLAASLGTDVQGFAGSTDLLKQSQANSQRPGSHRGRAEVLHRSARPGAPVVTEPR